MRRSKIAALLLVIVVAAVGGACNSQRSRPAASAAATPFVAAQITDRSEVDAWIKYVLTHDYCLGSPDPQMYRAPAMQRVLQAMIAEEGGQQQVADATWAVSRMSDGQIIASLGFNVPGGVKRIAFLVNPQNSQVTARNGDAEKAIARVRADCKK